MQGFKTDLSKWKVSWAPKGEGVSVSKKTQGGKTKVAAPITAPVRGNTKVKTIAEKLNIKINVKGKHNRNHEEDADEDEDDVQLETDDDNDNNEEVDERIYSDSDSDDEKKRTTMRGKSGLAGKGCLIDITKL
jgi:hypothetical protein